MESKRIFLSGSCVVIIHRSMPKWASAPLRASRQTWSRPTHPMKIQVQETPIVPELWMAKHQQEIDLKVQLLKKKYQLLEI